MKTACVVFAPAGKRAEERRWWRGFWGVMVMAWSIMARLAAVMPVREWVKTACAVFALAGSRAEGIRCLKGWWGAMVVRWSGGRGGKFSCW